MMRSVSPLPRPTECSLAWTAQERVDQLRPVLSHHVQDFRSAQGETARPDLRGLSRDNAIWTSFRGVRLDDAETLAGISLSQGRPPPFVIDVPAHRFFDTAVKILLCLPAQFRLQLRCVDGIARVMARPVGHILDQALMRLGRTGEDRPSGCRYA